MCGRYDNLIARDAYRGLFKANRLPKSNFPLRYNIAPTDQIPIVRIDPRDGECEVVLMARWGLIPFWMKEKPRVPHINARAETVDRLPLFREAFAKRRCLIPATGFYEWQQREDGKHVPLPPERLRALRLCRNLGVCSIGRGGHPVRCDDRRRTKSARRRHT
jgi:putative SOS response-associated peptidase YedK